MVALDCLGGRASTRVRAALLVPGHPRGQGRVSNPPLRCRAHFALRVGVVNWSAGCWQIYMFVGSGVAPSLGRLGRLLPLHP